MANSAKPSQAQRVDPSWPKRSEADRPVSELASATQGAPSPFGEIEFPVPADTLPYRHPVTEINR